MRSLEAAVYASTTLLNGKASFVFVIDSQGKLLLSTLGEASNEPQAWVRVARQTAEALAQRKLPFPLALPCQAVPLPASGAVLVPVRSCSQTRRHRPEPPTYGACACRERNANVTEHRAG